MLIFWDQEKAAQGRPCSTAKLCADQFQRIVGNDPLLVGRDYQGLGGTSLGDLATLAEAGSQVGVVIDVKAQQTQLVQGDFTDRGGVFTDTTGENNGVQTTVHGGSVGADVLGQAIAVNVIARLASSLLS